MAGETNVNFEKLKKEMLAKKQTAETQKKTDTSTNVFTNETVNIDKNINTSTNNDISKNTNVCENIDTNTNDDNCVNNAVNVNVYSNVNIDVNNFNYVLEVQNGSTALKRQTYYLKEETINKIEEYARKANIGKSELVQKILEDVLNKVKLK